MRARALLLVGAVAAALAWGAESHAAKPTPPATGTAITGKVIDAASGAALQGARVEALAASGGLTAATTDRKGAYTLALPAGGDYRVTASATSYQVVSQDLTVPQGTSASLNFALPALVPQPALPHAKRIPAYAGPQTCLGCHPGAIADEVFGSVHFQARSPWAGIDMPGAGSHGMLDRACGLPGTTLMANNYAGTAVSPVDGTTKDDGCGKCHIAYRPPQFYPSAQAALPDLDCLICHAAIYGAEWDLPENVAAYGANPEPHERVVVTLADGARSWSQDRSLRTAQSVGGPVSAHACDRCHEHGMGGYKRSTPYTAAADVHAAAGLPCTRCHTVSQHRIARGNFVTDGMANELPGVDVTCRGCHGASPHRLTANAADLNRHTANLRCETCHVHRMDATDNVARRAWAPYTRDPMTGQWQATPPTLSGVWYPGFWDAHTEYHPAGAWPTVRWFNGGASMLAQPYGGYADRASAGGEAMLFSFKPFTSGMLFDAAWLPGPPRDGSFDFVHGTWAYSMKWFYEQNWAKFVAFGFADARYPTAASYWAERPDMAQMLNAFPMMLQFDRAIFLSEAGVTAGAPVPGPQSAATYPGIARAIDVGMGRMGIDMGYFPFQSDPLQVGPYLWSGSFFGMWVPVNMDLTSAFYGELGSFITMSHAVKTNLSAAVDSCTACHYSEAEYASPTGAAPNKYLSFLDLGYPDTDGNGRVDPMWEDGNAPPVELACANGLDDDGDGLTDCADPDCVGLAGCALAEVKGMCTDGIDNDGNGLVDCADPGCARDRACR